jgi:hypothetical protein
MTRTTSTLSTLLVVTALLLSSTRSIAGGAGAVNPTSPSDKARAATEEVAGLRRVVIDTRRGNRLYVNLPDDVSAGDTVSGTVFAEAAGKTDAERAANLQELKDYTVEIDGRQVPATGGTFGLRIPAAPPPSVITVVLRDSKGKEVVKAELPVAPQAPVPAAGVKFPAHAQVGGFVEIGCPCDGALADGDYVKVSLTNIQPLTESPRKRVALNTRPEQGLRDVEFSERGQVTQGKMSVLGIKLSVLKQALMRGEKTSLTVEVSGLEGLSEDVPLLLENHTTNILTMEPANAQELTIRRSDVQPGGKYTIQRTLTGIRVGAFHIQGTVVRREVAAPQPTNDFNVSVVHNRLAFKTIEDYERVVNNPTEELRDGFLKTVNDFANFTPYGKSARSRDAKDAVSIADEYFASIINTDLAVQIGDNIFRVNPSTEKVYALPVVNAGQYQDLVAENTANKSIRVFSTGDNVLELIKKPAPAALFCKESGIGGKRASAIIPGSTVMASADFVRYGIYFTLHATIYPQGSWPSPFVFDFTGGAGHIHYHARCGSTADYATVSSGNWHLINQRYQSYQGSNNLNQLFFGFRVKHKASGQYVTPNITIRQNW